MSKKDLKILWEALKESLREIVMAILPGVLVYLKASDTTFAIIFYLIIRGLDSWLHEKGKVEKREVLKTGLTRF